MLGKAISIPAIERHPLEGCDGASYTQRCRWPELAGQCGGGNVRESPGHAPTNLRSEQRSHSTGRPTGPAVGFNYYTFSRKNEKTPSSELFSSYAYEGFSA